MLDVEGWAELRREHFVRGVSIKELARRWYPEAFEDAPAKDDGHRALADIRASIQELRYYRRSVFR